MNIYVFSCCNINLISTTQNDMHIGTLTSEVINDAEAICYKWTTKCKQNKL